MMETVDGLIAIAQQVQSNCYPNRSGSFVKWGLARGNFAFGSLARVGQRIQFRECQELCVATFDSSDDSELDWTERGHFSWVVGNRVVPLWRSPAQGRVASSRDAVHVVPGA